MAVESVLVLPFLALVMLLGAAVVIVLLVRGRVRGRAEPRAETRAEPRAEPAPRRRSIPGLLVILGVVALFLVALFGLYFVRSTHHQELRREAVRVAETAASARLRHDADAGTARVPSPAAVSLEPVLLSLRTRDDRADWLRDSELQEHSPERPAWIETNAGAERWVETDGSIAVESYRPGDAERIAGYSRYCASPAEARDEALEAANEKLTALVLWRLRDDARGKSEAWFDDLVPIARDVVGRRVVSAAVDWYAESVERPYGTVHRHAVLVDASPRVIAEASDELEARLTDGAVERLRFRRRLVSTLASAFGFALVVMLVYSFLNAGTKGHFAWPLRILSVLALGLLFLGILYWKGWLVV